VKLVPLTDHGVVSTGLNLYTGFARTQLKYRFWLSDDPGNPVLVYVHGIEGHSQWFDRTATQLSRFGINVYAADRRGTGLNRNTDSQFVNRKVLLSDLGSFLDTVKLQHPNSNLYLLGNCWGGTLSILYAKDVYKSYAPLSGLILSCPAIKTKCDVDWLTKFLIGWSYLCNSKKEFLFPLTPQMFTHTPQYLEFIRKDRLCTTAANARFLVETLTMQYLANKAAEKLDLPILVLQAGADDIVEQKAVAQWFERLRGHKSYHVFDGARHSLDFEIDISSYLDLITDWIREIELGCNRKH
jgi:alpha-beta hydrolase superfamily lysophospholipase